VNAPRWFDIVVDWWEDHLTLMCWIGLGLSLLAIALLILDAALS